MTIPSQLRATIADVATDLGPEAPTLCSPWSVRDLLAHLVVRESRPDALPGIGLPVPVLQRHTAAVQDRAAQQPFPELVEQVRSGPAPWWPTRVPALDAAVNTVELAVHLEDMVRAEEPWEPTALPGPTQQALWGAVSRMGRMLYRSAPVGVVAVADGYGRAALRRPPGDRGTVVLRGAPLELVLHAFGRTSVARIEVTGAPQDVAALAGHSRGV